MRKYCRNCWPNLQNSIEILEKFRELWKFYVNYEMILKTLRGKTWTILSAYLRFQEICQKHFEFILKIFEAIFQKLRKF